MLRRRSLALSLILAAPLSPAPAQHPPQHEHHPQAPSQPQTVPPSGPQSPPQSSGGLPQFPVQRAQRQSRPILITGRYWSAPEEHWLAVGGQVFFVAGPAANTLDQLLTRANLRMRAPAAIVTACATVSNLGRYGFMGRQRRQLSLLRLIHVTDPDGRVLLNRPNPGRGRC